MFRNHNNNAVDKAEFSPDGQFIISGGSDGDVRIWEAATGREIRVLERPQRPCIWFSAPFSRDGSRIVTGSADRTVRVWDTQKTGKELAILRGHEKSEHSAAFSPDGTRLVTRLSTTRLCDFGISASLQCR